MALPIGRATGTKAVGLTHAQKSSSRAPLRSLAMAVVLGSSCGRSSTSSL